MDMQKTPTPRRNRLAVVDLIAMVALALGVGLAASVVMGGAVLLFSAGHQDSVIADAAALHVASLGRP